MANAYSTPLNYQDSLNISDVARYTGAIQGAMQQKFDINLAKIDDLIGRISTVNLKRTQDKEYLGERLQKMLQMVDASGKLDLSNNNVGSQIKNYISGAIDDNVKKQIGNSEKIDQFDAQVKAMVKKDPKLYNDVNYSYARYKAGYNEYITGESNDLGGLNYSPYVDKNKVLDELKKVKELKGDQVMEIVDGNGRKRKTTLSGLTEGEIEKFMPQLLSSDVLNQLKMDGWYRYKDNMPVAKDQFNKYKTARASVLQNDITEQEAITNNDLKTPKEKAQARASLDYLKKEKTSMETFLGSVDENNAEEVGYFLEKGSYQQSLVKLASGRVSVSEEVDAAFFQQKNLELAYEKNEREIQELELKRQKEAREAGESVGGPSGFVASDVPTTELPENPDFLKTLTQDHGSAYKNIQSIISTAYNGDFVSDDQRKEYDANLAKKGFVIKNGEIRVIKGSEEKAAKYSRATAAIEAFTASKMNVSYPEQAKELAKSDLKSQSLSNTISQVTSKTYTQEFNKEPDTYIDQLKQAQEFTNNPGLVDNVTGLFNSPADLLAKTGVGAVAGGAGGALVGGPLAVPLAAAAAVTGGVIGFLYGSNSARQANNETIKKTGQKINAFVNSNGGWENLKRNIGTNQNKIKQLSDLIKESQEVSSGLFSGWKSNLDEKARGSANSILMEMNQKGNGAYLTTFKQYNVINKKDRESISLLISQGGESNGAKIDLDSPLTILPQQNGSLVIRQNKGSKINAAGETITQPPVEEVASKGSALYNFVTSKISMTGDSLGLNANTARSMKIAPYVTPGFVGEDNNQETLRKAQGALSGLNPKVVKAFQVNPVMYLDKNSTKKAFYAALSGQYKTSDLDKMVDLLDENLEDFSLVVRPMDGVWGATVTNKTNNQLVGNGKFTDSSSNLDDDMLNLARNYPQTIIIDQILQALKLNPGSANKIFNIQ